MFALPLRRAVLPAIFGVALLLTTALPPAPTFAQVQSGLWPAAVAITTTTGGPAEPAMAFDLEGYRHVVYYAGNTNSWFIYYTNNRSGTWSTPRVIESRGAGQRYPDIAVGPDNHIHVIYTRESAGNIIHVESPDAGATWLPSTTISDSPRSTIAPSIAVDSNNVVHIAWCDRRWGDFGATYARRVNGVWSAPRQVGLGAFERQTDIAVTGSGPNVKVHIVFEARIEDNDLLEDFDVYYVRGDGANFNPPRNISGDKDQWSLAPSIATNGLNELYVVWDLQDRYHDIAFTRSTTNGDTWVPFTNITRRNSGSYWPNVAYGAGGLVHIGWFEAETGASDRDLLYLSYDPVNNQYGQYTELIARQMTASASPGLGAAINSDQVAATSQSVSPRRIFTSNRGTGRKGGAPILIVSGAARLNSGADTTASRQVTAELTDVLGAPDQMRYAWNRDPDASDQWQPFKASFALTAPDGGCAHTLRVQLRSGDTLSAVFGDSITIDQAVQASLSIRNPGVGDPDYTSSGIVEIATLNQGECTSLRRLITSEGVYTVTDSAGIIVRPQLSDPRVEGSRQVTARVEDAAGNQLALTRTMIIDRTPPRLASGAQLSITAPQEGLPTLLATLTFSGVVLTDTYPRRFWGIELANVDPTASQTSEPTWYPVEVAGVGQSDSTFVLNNWSLLSGLNRTLSTARLSNQQIEVRARFLDGAGNIGADVLTTTVRLSSTAQPARTLLSLVAR